MMLKTPTDKDLERFWSKVNKTETCWLWTGAARNGYGIFKLDSTSLGAHRFSFSLVEPLDNNKQVCHTCDVPACVNPEHLYQGTAKINSDDKMFKDRHNFTLTNEQVMDIRSRELTGTICRDLAKEFDVSAQYIKHVLTGKIYAWLPGERTVPAQFTAQKLSATDVENIISRLETGKHGIIKKLAEEYDVDRQTISNIKYRRRKYTET